jgi:hypothetical protein
MAEFEGKLTNCAFANINGTDVEEAQYFIDVTGARLLRLWNCGYGKQHSFR